MLSWHCKKLLRSDGQQRNYGKAKFPSNLNCGQKTVSETGPWHQLAGQPPGTPFNTKWLPFTRWHVPMHFLDTWVWLDLKKMFTYYLLHFLNRNCARWHNMTSENLVNIGSGNGLLPDCTPAIVDLLTYRPSGINSSVTFTWIPSQDINPQLVFKIYTFGITATYHRGQPVEFHWDLFPRVQLTITQHWIRYWMDWYPRGNKPLSDSIVVLFTDADMHHLALMS